jgi:hypothetical protein
MKKKIKRKCLKDKDGFVIGKLSNFPCDDWHLCERMVIPDEKTDCYYRIEFDEESERNYFGRGERDIIVYLMYMKREFIEKDFSMNFSLWNFTEELTEDHNHILDVIEAVFGINFDGEVFVERGINDTED